jgi:hypothetical protein
MAVMSDTIMDLRKGLVCTTARVRRKNNNLTTARGNQPDITLGTLGKARIPARSPGAAAPIQNAMEFDFLGGIL